MAKKLKELSISAVKDMRKAEVSKLLVRGYKVHQIIEYITAKGIVKPDGTAFSRSTIGIDIRELCAEWKEQSFEMIDNYRSRVWSEIQEVKKKGWEGADYHLVLQAIKQERELMGLDLVNKDGLIDIKDIPQIVYIRKDECNIHLDKIDDNQ